MGLTSWPDLSSHCSLQWKVSLPMGQRGWNEQNFNFTSTPNHSKILWFHSVIFHSRILWLHSVIFQHSQPYRVHVQAAELTLAGVLWGTSIKKKGPDLPKCETLKYFQFKFPLFRACLCLPGSAPGQPHTNWNFGALGLLMEGLWLQECWGAVLPRATSRSSRTVESGRE